MTRKNKTEDANVWEEEWREMPEYNNVKRPEPVIEAVFKFETEEDYKDFLEKIRPLFEDGKPFDGMQRKNRKSTWYPHRPRGSAYRVVDDES